MVEIPEHVPRYLLNLVAGVNHVHALVDCVLHFNGQHACVPMEILRFTLEAIEPMCILQFECRNTSYCLYCLKIIHCVYLG